ncbi:precorrin-3B C(17)-methyltransferase [Raineyella sp. W15-4]|uniref:precorrin-3B C(17)-methyltransferase n=1 Tax=Raineyella sp. W15-4 TaxID=3081651 RepID=UPI0029540BA5|nr:precorrin-3B C(17)-methyltransferase [Raineyella sp. W15-4]WOQ16782.1 precorrin-3B C(17)-methyltransferase [Raineyella sp. W15-4]
MTGGGVGHLWGVGVGPGDPELITRKAARLIAAADVIAYHSGPKGESIARRIADDLVPAGVVEELLRYPVTTGDSAHPLGYYGEIGAFYDACAERLAVHLAAGRDVVVLAEGDPLFYGSYMYLHDRLADRFPSEVVPGVPALAAASAATGTGLARHEDVLTVLPGTLPVPELARRLADTDAAVIMKLGRTFPGVVEALRQAGRLADAWYVERASGTDQLVARVADVDPARVPYMSMVLVPGPDTRADAAGRAAGSAVPLPTVHAPGGRTPDGRDRAVGRAAPTALSDDSVASSDRSAGAEVLVIGLGPGPDHWLTPEASAALGAVDHIVGYAPYVNRVPQRAGLQRHASGNTVEVDRARFALDLARRGERVAVVSGGDAGVFGMAAAVFEAAEDPAYADVPVRVLPGVTAAQAVAARAGAPMGADFAIMSLSDRLKPWQVIADRLRHISRADLVLALYNPRSKARPEQLFAARDILLDERGPETVVVVGRDVGRAEESLQVTSLGAWDPAEVDMKCLVMIGARSTRVTPGGQVWTPRFVED